MEEKDKTISKTFVEEDIYIERPIRFYNPFELSFGTWRRQEAVHQCSKQPLNVNAREFKKQRNEVTIPEARIPEAAEANKDEL